MTRSYWLPSKPWLSGFLLMPSVVYSMLASRLKRFLAATKQPEEMSVKVYFE